MAETCTLRFTRRGGYADALRAYKLFVNGAQVSTIRRHSTIELQAPSGPLTLEARVDWGRCPPLRLDAASGERIEIEVANHWGALLSLWGITFGTASYLTLTRLPPAAGATGPSR